VNAHRRAKPLNTIELGIVAVVASWTAGFVDTVGFLLLSDILTANMSGNTVRIGVSAVTTNGFEALRRGWPVLIFVVGLIVSATIHEYGARRKFLSTSAITFGLEALLLVGFDVLYVIRGSSIKTGTSFFTAAAALAFAMGLQNATVTRVGALSVKTTHVTGTLTKFAEGASQFFFWIHDRLRAAGPYRWRRVLRVAPYQKSFREAVLMLLLWVAFIVGAICGAAGQVYFGHFALAPPVVAAVALAAVDLARPIAASEEHKMSGPRRGEKAA